MNRENAINYLRSSGFSEEQISEIEKAFTCEDAISREEVLNILDDLVKDYIKENDFDKAQGVAWVKVQKLPPVSTEKTGRWECVQYDFDVDGLPIAKHCPNRGCRKMGVEE